MLSVWRTRTFCSKLPKSIDEKDKKNPNDEEAQMEEWDDRLQETQFNSIWDMQLLVRKGKIRIK